MCGIVAIISKKERAEREHLISALVSIAHRGPDSLGIHLSNGVGLGIARLSIVDIEGGNQPLTNERGTIFVVCNGEIYNYRALRKELEEKGHRFSSHSDVETLVHLYEEHGESFVERLNGMFAFVLLDTEKRLLIAGRDRLGIKPLLVFENSGHLILASEAKAIFASGLVEPKLDRRAIREAFVFNYIMGEQTAFEGIKNFTPGTLSHWNIDGGERKSSAYWTAKFPDARPFSIPSATPYANELRSCFESSIGNHLIGDVPIGSYLSGGLDSTITAITAAKAVPAPLNTFSIRVHGEGYDESPQFLKTVETFGFSGHTFDSRTVTPEDFMRALYHAEQPNMNPLDVPMIGLSGLVRARGMKVVLSGEGSDELFGGYFAYTLNQARRALNMVPALKRSLMGKLLKYYISSPEYASQVGEELLKETSDVEDRFGVFPAWYPNWAILQRASDPLFLERWDSLGDDSELARLASPIRQHYRSIDDFDKSLYLDLQARLPNYILHRLDRHTMANSVEGRVPFLSNEMIDLACRIPPVLKMFGLKEKSILRKAFKHVIPPHVMKQMKFGYNVPPKSLWEGRSELREELMSERGISESGIFDPQAVFDLRQRSTDLAQSGHVRDQATLMLTGILSVQMLHRSFIAEREFSLPHALTASTSSDVGVGNARATS